MKTQENHRLTIFVCSPFGSDLGRNLDVARMVCRRLVEIGYAPFAPHLFYPWLGLDDRDQDQREIGLACSEAWVSRAQLLVTVLLDGVATDGMRRDIDAAHKANVPILEIHGFNWAGDLLQKVEAAIAESRAPARHKKSRKT